MQLLEETSVTDVDGLVFIDVSLFAVPLFMVAMVAVVVVGVVADVVDVDEPFCLAIRGSML